MPLPTDFGEFEHLQNLITKEHNKLVRLYFKNQLDDDISTPKAGLKHACLIKDSDSALNSLLRLWLFEITVGHAASIQTPIYGIPVTEAQTDWKFRPQVRLYFEEDYDKETHGVEGLSRLSSDISFRLMNETASTITRVNAETLARQIKSEMGKPIFTWNRGWYKCTYKDAEKGYDFRMLVKSKSEGLTVVKKLLSIQNHTFDNDFFQFIEHDKSYPANPGTHTVYGRTVKKPIKRRVGLVKFRFAQLIIPGKVNPVNLVATAGSRLRSVIEVL